MADIKVLVVDDTAINLMLMKKIISTYGCEVDTAGSGEEALKLLTENKYDIVFMDYLMPQMDGVETTQNIRKNSDVPVVAITGDTSDEVQELFKNAGINDFVEKPVPPDVVKEMLVKWAGLEG